MRTPYVRPLGKSIKEPMWLRIGKLLCVTLLTVAFAVFTSIMLIEWLAGCGESYIDANGVRHINECVFIPNQH